MSSDVFWKSPPWRHLNAVPQVNCSTRVVHWQQNFCHHRLSLCAFMTHCLRLNLQLHTISLVRTCRISSFCTVAWQLARLLLARSIARSLGDSWASCINLYCLWRCNDGIIFRVWTCVTNTFPTRSEHLINRNVSGTAGLSLTLSSSSVLTSCVYLSNSAVNKKYTD